MSDFHQNGIVATLHRLRARPIEALERDIEGWCSARPVGLVLPCLYSELRGEGLPRIADELKSVRYLDSLVVPIGRASHAEFQHACEWFAKLPQRTTLLWMESPRWLELLSELRARGLVVGHEGKGAAVWTCLGFLLAEDRVHTIALHDADIRTYSRELLARLVYPVVSPLIDYDFCKGYYARIAKQMYGRVTRLLVFPYLRSLQVVLGQQPYVDYLASFRYPLSGEFALTADLARVMRVPTHWGLEIGVLSEVFRSRSMRRICQAELIEHYDHKHQEVSAARPDQGLHRMALDVVGHLLRTISQTGVVLGRAELQAILAAYRRAAEDSIVCHHADALVDGLDYDRHEEEQTVGVFARAIASAQVGFLDDSLGEVDLPNWVRVSSALPSVFDELRAIAAEDGGELWRSRAGQS